MFKYIVPNKAQYYIDVNKKSNVHLIPPFSNELTFNGFKNFKIFASTGFPFAISQKRSPRVSTKTIGFLDLQA